MRRRLAAAAIFVGILLILLWISQPSAHGLAQHGKHQRKGKPSNPCLTDPQKESSHSGLNIKNEDSSGEVVFEPQYIYLHSSPLTSAPVGFILGWLSLPFYLASLRRSAPKPIRLDF